MKIEFVGFYPMTNKPKTKNQKKMLGTIHIYLIEQELDIRGIVVAKRGKNIFFLLPHFRAIEEDGKQVRYPLIRFTNEAKQKELFDFLHKEVKPQIHKELSVKSK